MMSTQYALSRKGLIGGTILFDLITSDPEKRESESTSFTKQALL